METVNIFVYLFGLHYLCTMNQAIDFIEVVVNAKEQTRRKIESLINELKP